MGMPYRPTIRTETLTACPICASATLRTALLGRDFDLHTGDYRIDQCGACGLRFTNPRPIAEDVPLLYADRSFETLPAGSSPLARLRRARLTRRIRAIAKGQSPKRWADIGTGDGFFAEVVSEQPFCARMTAVDFFDEPPALLRNAVASGQVEYSSLAAFFAGNARYDVICARFVLEHVQDPRAFVASLRERLESGGLLVVEVPNWNSIWRRVFGKYHAELSLPAHTFHFDPDTLRGIMTGFHCEIREDIHGVTLGKSLGNVFGSAIARTGPLAMAALGIELLIDAVIGPPSNMTLLATKL